VELVFFALLGILSGIVLNRAAENLPPPARRSLLVAPLCPYCETPRSALAQSGILSFLLRRERCTSCGAPLPLRAPLVEIAAAALFVLLALRYPPGLYLLALCFFTAVLMLIVVIDLEHKLILNSLVLPATLLALLASPIVLGGANTTLDKLNWKLIGFSLLGAAVGYGITISFYLFGVLFLRLVNRRRAQKINTVAFGMGDVKLAGLLGALIAFPAIFYALIYAVLLGGIGAFLAIVLRLVQRRRYSAFMAIPYGPYLILAAWAFLIYGQEATSRILG
jgi:leader peptidase (prepilin peptidase) / N-methyltransferase